MFSSQSLSRQPHPRARPPSSSRQPSATGDKGVHFHTRPQLIFLGSPKKRHPSHALAANPLRRKTLDRPCGMSRPPRRKHAQQLAHVSELRGLPCILRTQSSPSRCPSRVSEPRPCGSVLRRLCLRLCLCHLSSDSSHTDKFRPSTLRLARAIKIPSPRVIPVLKLVRIAGGPVCQNLLSRSWSWILDSGLILPVCSLRLRRSVRLFSVQFRSLTCTALPPGGASPPRPNPAQRAPSVLEDFSWRCSQ